MSCDKLLVNKSFEYSTPKLTGFHRLLHTCVSERRINEIVTVPVNRKPRKPKPLIVGAGAGGSTSKSLERVQVAR